MGNEVKILFVDDEPNVLRALQRLLVDEEYTLLQAESGEKGLQILAEEEPVQLVVSDYRMPHMNGVDFLKKVYARWPETVRIVLSGYADTAAVVAAVNEGHIYKFIPKPWNDDELKVTIAKAVEVYSLRRENTQLTSELQRMNEKLVSLNEQLDRRVQERTSEMIFQNRVLQRGQHLLQSLPVAVFGFDDNLELVQYNRLAHDFVEGGVALSVGIPAAELFPSGVFDFVAKTLPGQVVAMKTVLGGKEVCVKGVRLEPEEGLQGIVLVMYKLGCYP